MPIRAGVFVVEDPFFVEGAFFAPPCLVPGKRGGLPQTELQVDTIELIISVGGECRKRQGVGWGDRLHKDMILFEEKKTT